MFLVKQNRISEAKASIRFYQNMSETIDDQKSINDEIEHLKSQINKSENRKKSVKFSDLVENPGRKALIIGTYLVALSHISGSFSLINYGASIFQEAGSVLSSNQSALIIGIIQLISASMVPLLVDRVGRKVRKPKP